MLEDTVTCQLDDQVTSPESLSMAMKQAMFELFRQYYDAVSFSSFELDLMAKDHVLMLNDKAGQLRGFTSMALIDFEFHNHKQRAIFSGDTIVQHQYWGEKKLLLSWCRYAGQIKAQQPTVPLYWFLISKGVRTYQYLPLFSHHYIPSPSDNAPNHYQHVLQHLAKGKFAEAYQADSGLIIFPTSRGQLVDKWAELPPSYRSRPEAQFFLKINPGYQQGHELACLTELCSENLIGMAKRSFDSGYQHIREIQG